MTRRGPDGAGEWYSDDNRTGLGHRRLAIIDLSESGSQPMCNEDRKVWITFNGEIYNYQTLRSQLLAQGHRFKSNSDTEVIIHGYEEWGIEKLLKNLRGMFAFALHDSRVTGSRSPVPGSKSLLFIARDPFGIKPLYYADDGKTFRAASQVKALLAGGNINTSPDSAGHVGFFLWGHVPEPYTLYKGIRSLPAGSYMCVPDGLSSTSHSSLFAPHSYNSIPALIAEAERSQLSLSREEVQGHLRAALLDSVKHHFIADVPVGVFLSAGLDSGTLVGLASEIEKGRLHTVTLAFKEYMDTHDDESALSTFVADRYHTMHETIWVSKKEFRGETEHIIDAMDQPTTDGINSYFVSKAAVKAGLKVAISGLGGDELFGSYPSFKQIPKMAKMFGSFRDAPFSGRAFRVVTAPVLKHFTSPKYAGLLEYGGSYAGAYLLRRGMFMPWELPELLDGEMVKEGWGDLQTLLRLHDTVQGITSSHLRVSALEMCWYMRNQLLRDTDWASMAHSLEVRVPIVDVSLLHAICSLSSSPWFNKQSMAATPLNPLPQEIVGRGKTGFSVPVRQWMTMDDGEVGERGLRGWAKKIYSTFAHGENFNYARPSHLSQGENRTARSPRARAILIYRTGQLGDTLVAMPAIGSIKKRFPDHRLVLLTDRHPGSGYVSSWEVLRPTGWFDEVIFYIPSDGRWDTMKNMSYLVKKLRGVSPEYIFALSPRRTIWQKTRDKFFFRFLVGVSHCYQPQEAIKSAGKPDGKTEAEWRRLLSIVGGDAGNDVFKLQIPAIESDDAHRKLAEEGIKLDAKMLAIGPGSKRPTTKWPKERYAALGSCLLNTFSDMQLLIFGGKADKEIGDELCREWGNRSYNLAGKLSIYGSAAILEKCFGYVGNDTGTMHLAAMVGKPCIGIFSARNHPGEWDPYGDKNTIIRHETACAGCRLEECVEYQNMCLSQIEVVEVLKAVEAVIASCSF